MTYGFSNGPNSIMTAFFEHAAKAKDGGPAAERHQHLMMLCLVGLYDVQGRGDTIAPEVLAHFRHQSGATLASFTHDLGVYVRDTLYLAGSANEYEWDELCWRRSAIQSILDDYAGTPVVTFIDCEDVAALDSELRRLGREQGPLPDSEVPEGLPESHWWWRYPPSGR